jgi:hypothetical protein
MVSVFMADKTGKLYENLAQVVFQAIVNQNDVSNVVVEHNVVLTGKHTSHQIDVYWKFVAAHVEYETIVQCKDHENPINQGELLKFKAVLDDLPGQPKGIFVSRAGYQSGAIDFAKAHGILLHELREADYPPSLLITTVGWAHYRVVPMALSGVIKGSGEDLDTSKLYAMAFDYTVFSPTFSQINIGISTGWLKDNYPDMDTAVIRSGGLFSSVLHENELYDDSGEVIGNLGKLFQTIAQSVSNEGLSEKRVTHKCEVPTFIRTSSAQLPKIQVDSISTDIKIEQRREVRRARMSNFAQWVLHDLNTDKTHWFAITPSASAQLSGE